MSDYAERVPNQMRAHFTMNELLALIYDPGNQKLFFMVFLGSMAYALKLEAITITKAMSEFFRRLTGGMFAAAVGLKLAGMSFNDWFWIGMGTGYVGHLIWRLLEVILEHGIEKLPTILLNAINGYLKQFIELLKSKKDNGSVDS